MRMRKTVSNYITIRDHVLESAHDMALMASNLETIASDIEHMTAEEIRCNPFSLHDGALAAARHCLKKFTAAHKEHKSAVTLLREYGGTPNEP